MKYPTFRQKIDLFFIDYEMIPLLVQENYLNSMGDKSSLSDIERLAEAADFISVGDCINRQVRTNQDWSLLPNLGICSSIAPCLIAKGTTFYPRFPEWLGKNSSQRKAKRLIRELKKVMAHHAQASRMEIQNEYTELLLLSVFKQLKRFERDGDKGHVGEAIEFMKDLGITQEHFKEHLMGLCMDKKTVRDFEELNPQTKSAFTKEANKELREDLKGKKAGGKKEKSAEEEEDEDEEDEKLLEED